MKLTALLPMKGHSERVPNKNMRPFADRPLYHRVAETLEKSTLIDSIIINTDSKIIAADAIMHFPKVRIHERPAELRGDFVAMNDIINYDINLLPNEYFLQTHSTNPLLTVETVNEAILKFEALISDFDSLFSVTMIQTRLYWESGIAVNHDPSVLLRTQDLPPIFEENSNIYIFSRKAFIEAGNKRIGLNPQMFVMNKLETVDIDEEEDFIFAEALFQLRKNGK